MTDDIMTSGATLADGAGGVSPTATAPSASLASSPSGTSEIAASAPVSVLSAASETAATPVAAQPQSDAQADGQSQTDAQPAQDAGADAPLPNFEGWTLPDGVQAEPDAMQAFGEALGAIELQTKGDHAEMQAFGQKLVDLHVAQMEKTISAFKEHEAAQRVAEYNGWRQNFVNDPEIGGNRQETTVREAGEFIKMYGGSKEQRKELAGLLDQTGVGNHPALIRLLSNAHRSLVSEGVPLAATQAVKAKPSTYEKFYGTAS